ncbi:MAG: restriction endonuclease subunit S [Lawsonibacter sp.]|nr:restriction endonuclease subunit S [Lawsonibacter sp.]
MIARLGDVATYVNGYAFKPSDWSDIGLPIIRIQDLTGNSYQANRYNGEYDKRYEIHDGDVLISWSASLGVYVWMGEKAVLNQHIFKVVFNKLEVDKSFFVHQVRNILENSVSQAHGATMKHLTKPVFDALPFNLPSVAEQQRISSALDKLTSMISLRKRQLARLDELVKSRFVEMFGDPVRNPYGWEIRHFEEISTLITDGEHVTPRRVESGIYLLSARNVLNHAIQVDDVDYIDQTEYARIAKRVVPQGGDILISCSGSIGRCCVVPDNFKFQMVRSIALIRFRKQINPVFAEWLITSDDLQRQILQAATQSSQANLFQGRIKKLRGYVPPLKLQDRFADFVVKINRQKLTIQQSLDQLEVLRKSLMQEYFG